MYWYQTGDMEAKSMDKDKEQHWKLTKSFNLSENIKSLSGIYLKHSYRILEKKPEKQRELDKPITRLDV